MELAVAKPALMAAQEAVNCLDKGSLTELKSFSKVRRASQAHAVGRDFSICSVPICIFFLRMTVGTLCTLMLFK